MQKLSFSAFRGVSEIIVPFRTPKSLPIPNMNAAVVTACPRRNLLNPIQKIAASVEDISSMEASSHPGHNLTPLPVDRQELSPSELAELRDACAVLARQVSIAAQALEDSRNRRESNRKPKKEKNAPKQSSQTRTSQTEPQGRSSRRRDDGTHASPLPPSKSHAPVGYVPVSPTNKVSSSSVDRHANRLSTQGADGIDPDPLALVRVPKSKCQVNPVHLSSDRLGRPVTSPGASGDHLASSLDTTSHYTSQTATTLDQPSTRLSSWSSPANERKSSPGSNCVSEQISPHRLSSSAAGVAAKTWMMQELSHCQASSSGGRTVRPGSCGPTPYRTAGTDRPGSRAGTIKDTLRDYIRSRPSSDGVHASARSDSTNLRRFDSRRGQESHGGGSNWWRGSGLGSGKGRNSFRLVKADEAGPASGTEGSSPNLNRELPALPGLDQYRERKPSATHVAQLMRPKPAMTVKPTGEQQAPPPPPPPPPPPQHGQTSAGGANPIPDPARVESERTRHQEAVQRAMEDRMRHHTRMASATFGLYARQKAHAARKRAQTTAMESSPPRRLLGTQGREKSKEVPMPVPASNRASGGFRNRVSRFLGRGGGGGEKANAG